VTRTESENDDDVGSRLEELTLALGSVVQARKQRYVMANVERARLEEVRRILPGIGGPDIVELLDGGALIAVQAVVALSSVSATISALKAIGATGIVVTRIERFIP
jgi:ATP phosphoribosyltransferase